VILILRALGLGDLLTGVPAMRALRRALPQHRLVLAGPRSLAPLARWAVRLDDDIAVSGLEPLPCQAAGAALAVNLHGRGPRSTALLRATRAQRLVAFDDGGPVWDDDEHDRVRWCRLLVESGVVAEADTDDMGIEAPPLPARFAGRVDGATVIHPGASSAARRWPIERWAAVAAVEACSGRPVVVTGTRAEAGLAHAVARRAGLEPDAVVAGQTSVLDLAGLVGAAARVACGDTGVAHLASALGTPSVVLFGPVSPSRWGPPSRQRHIALWAGIAGDPHGDVPSEGLLRITVSDVVGCLARLPEGSTRR
jgi:ADP-heptose:LPS heptosyltransferase